MCFCSHACPLYSIRTDTGTNGHTDTRSDKLQLNDQMWGSLTFAPNYCVYTYLQMFNPPNQFKLDHQPFICCNKIQYYQIPKDNRYDFYLSKYFLGYSIHTLWMTTDKHPGKGGKSTCVQEWKYQYGILRMLHSMWFFPSILHHCINLCLGEAKLL